MRLIHPFNNLQNNPSEPSGWAGGKAVLLKLRSAWGGEGIELCYVNSIFPHSHLEQRANLKGFLAWWQMKHSKLNARGYHYKFLCVHTLYTVVTLQAGNISSWHYIPEQAAPVASLSLQVSHGIHQTVRHTTSNTWVSRRATAFFFAFSLPRRAGGGRRGVFLLVLKSTANVITIKDGLWSWSFFPETITYLYLWVPLFTWLKCIRQACFIVD